MGSCYSNKNTTAKIVVGGVHHRQMLLEGVNNKQILLRELYKDVYTEKARNAPLLQLHTNTKYLQRTSLEKIEGILIPDMEGLVSIGSLHTFDS